MGKLQYIPSFYFYKFANSLSAPYTDMVAYRSGIIDASGNLIGNESSIDPFEYFIIKLKKIFEQLPPGVTRYKTGNLFGVMELFSEEAKNFGLSEFDFEILMEAELLCASGGEFGYYDLKEEMTTGSAAGSLGVPSDSPSTNKGSVSGFDPKLGSVMTRAEPVNMLSAVEMFTLPSTEYKMFKAAKSYPKTPTGNYLRRFGYRNNQSKIAIRDDETGEIHWLPAPNKKTFVEEFKLGNLKILNEDDSDLVQDVLDRADDIEPTDDALKSAFEKAMDRAERKRIEELGRSGANSEKKGKEFNPNTANLGGDGAETAGAVKDLLDSLPLIATARGSRSGDDFLANFFGAWKRTAGRESSSDSNKLDSMKLIDNSSPLWKYVPDRHTMSLPNSNRRIGILGINQKNLRATSPTVMSPEELAGYEGSPIGEIEEYEKMLNLTDLSDENKRDMQRIKGEIERWGRSARGLETRRGILTSRVTADQPIYQVVSRGKQSVAPTETILTNIRERPGRFRLGKTGRVDTHVYPQAQAQKPEAYTLLTTPGTVKGDFEKSSALSRLLTSMGMNGDEIIRRADSILRGEFDPQEYEREKNRRIASKE